MGMVLVGVFAAAVAALAARYGVDSRPDFRCGPDGWFASGRS